MRVGDGGDEVLQFAGVPKRVQREALMGQYVKQDARTVLVELQRAFMLNANRLAPVLDATRVGVERARRLGRNFQRSQDDGTHEF